MEIEVLEQGKDKLVAYIIGLDNTVLNVVINRVQQHKSVIAAAFTLEHPLNPKPKVLIQTDGKATPKDVLLASIDTVGKEYDAFAKDFKKAFA